MAKISLYSLLRKINVNDTEIKMRFKKFKIQV